MSDNEKVKKDFAYELSQSIYKWEKGYRKYNEVICKKCGQGSTLPERVVNLTNIIEVGYCDRCGKCLIMKK